VGGDLNGRVSVLSDTDAIAALIFLLDLEDATVENMEYLQALQDGLPEAFATAADVGEFAAPEPDTSLGDLARAALVYLAEQGPSGGERVRQALERPRPVGQRDPVTFAVGGLIVLALRSDLELKRTPAGKWSFSYRLKPVKDSQLGVILSKLWGLFGGGQG
jgi:hypothetical protein